MANEEKSKDAKSRTRNILPGTHFHRIRRTVQSICFLIFVLLPLFDVMRVDLPRQRFFFFGAELYINEFAIVFLTMMFLWILVAAGAMIYGLSLIHISQELDDLVAYLQTRGRAKDWRPDNDYEK